jgi:hypothetical protein
MSEWDNLAAEALADVRHKGPRCGVRTVLDALGTDDRAEAEKAIDNEDIPASALRRALFKRLGDDTPAAHTITRHRRRECSCGKARS